MKLAQGLLFHFSKGGFSQALDAEDFVNVVVAGFFFSRASDIDALALWPSWFKLPANLVLSDSAGDVL